MDDLDSLVHHASLHVSTQAVYGPKQTALEDGRATAYRCDSSGFVISRSALRGSVSLLTISLRYSLALLSSMLWVRAAILYIWPGNAA